MKMGDGEELLTMRNDQEVAGVSAEREYVRQVSQQEQRIETTWRWLHRADCGSLA